MQEWTPGCERVLDKAGRKKGANSLLETKMLRTATAAAAGPEIAAHVETAMHVQVPPATPELPVAAMLKRLSTVDIAMAAADCERAAEHAQHDIEVCLSLFPPFPMLCSMPSPIELDSVVQTARIGIHKTHAYRQA